MKALVTGATGLIGNAIAHELVARGHHVRALVREPERARRLLPPEVELVRGDITRPESLPSAARGIDWLFHSAGLPEQWQPDEGIFDRVNRQGTVNVLSAALAEGVKRVVYTSTMDVFAAPPGGTLVETNLDAHPKSTAYERSKQAAEREAEGLRARGLDVVYVNPSAVYGPGPVHVALNSFFIQILNRQAPALPPGGVSVAYIDGVTAVHLAAAERGVPGERYLIADTHVSNQHLATEILRLAGGGRPPPVAPLAVMKLLATVSAPLARTFGFTPPISSGQLTFLTWDVRVDSSKARRDLGLQPTPLTLGIERTITALRAQGLVPPARAS